MEARKRKAEDAIESAPGGDVVSEEDVAELAEILSKEQLVSIVKQAALSNADILSKLQKLVDEDPAARKLYVGGLRKTTDRDTLKDVFKEYGPVEEAIVVKEKSKGKSMRFGFVTFKHRDAAIRALKQRAKMIEGAKTKCKFAHNPQKSKDEGIKLGSSSVGHAHHPQRSKDEGVKVGSSAHHPQKSKDEGVKLGPSSVGYDLTNPALIASHNPSFLQSSSHSLAQSLNPAAGMSSLHGIDPLMSRSLPPDSAYASSSLASMYGLSNSDHGSLSSSYRPVAMMHNRQVSGYSSLPRSSFY